jgi:hypothetical protein
VTAPDRRWSPSGIVVACRAVPRAPGWWLVPVVRVRVCPVRGAGNGAGGVHRPAGGARPQVTAPVCRWSPSGIVVVGRAVSRAPGGWLRSLFGCGCAPSGARGTAREGSTGLRVGHGLRWLPLSLRRSPLGIVVACRAVPRAPGRGFRCRSCGGWPDPVGARGTAREGTAGLRVGTGLRWLPLSVGWSPPGASWLVAQFPAPLGGGPRLSLGWGVGNAVGRAARCAGRPREGWCL